MIREFPLEKPIHITIALNYPSRRPCLRAISDLMSMPIYDIVTLHTRLEFGIFFTGENSFMEDYKLLSYLENEENREEEEESKTVIFSLFSL